MVWKGVPYLLSSPLWFACLSCDTCRRILCVTFGSFVIILFSKFLQGCVVNDSLQVMRKTGSRTVISYTQRNPQPQLSLGLIYLVTLYLGLIHSFRYLCALVLWKRPNPSRAHTRIGRLSFIQWVASSNPSFGDSLCFVVRNHPRCNNKASYTRRRRRLIAGDLFVESSNNIQSCTSDAKDSSHLWR